MTAKNLEKMLPKRWYKRVFLAPGVFSPDLAVGAVDALRYEARLAYLDGRAATARKLNGYAAAVLKVLAQKPVRA